jgi:hypothetical protein
MREEHPLEFHIYLIGSLCVAATIFGAMVAHTHRGSNARTIAILAFWIIGIFLVVDFVTVWTRPRDPQRITDSQSDLQSALGTPTPSPISTPAILSNNVVATATSPPKSTPTPTATPTPRPSPTPSPTETPIPTPSAVSTPAPEPALLARTPISTPESAPQTKRLRLGDLLVEVVGLSNGGKGLLRLDLTLTNVISKTLYVFAGSAPLTVFDVPRAQALTGTASDELNNAYALDSIQGFTTERDFYFGGVNFFLELPPSESSSVTFIFKVTSLYWDNSRPPRRVSLNVELAVVGDPSIKGSHRTRSLSLTRQPVE